VSFRARIVLVAAIALMLPAPLGAQPAGRSAAPWNLTRRDEDLALRLVTIGPGDAIHEYWGHNALWVEDSRRGASVLYNFGMFDFGGDMLPKYLRGQLEFWVAATPAQPTFDFYAAANRSLRVRELALDPARRRYLAERLAWYALPENRHYRYHHYENNCSTKLRDLIDEATEGQLSRQSRRPARLSYRGHTWRYTERDPIVRFLLVLWMNDSMEQPITAWDEAFLPDELERIVDEARIDDGRGGTRPLVGRAATLYEAHRAPVPRDPALAWPGLLALGALLGGAALGLGRRREPRALRVGFGLYQALIGVALGVPGLVLGLFVFTGWEVTHWNENLFLANPLTFLALPCGLMLACGARRGERFMGACWGVLAGGSLLLLLLKLLPRFDQATLLPLCLYLPVNLGFAAAYWLRARASTGAPARR